LQFHLVANKIGESDDLFIFLACFLRQQQNDNFARSIYRDRWDFLVFSFFLVRRHPKVAEGRDGSFRVLALFAGFVVVQFFLFSVPLSQR
jgi:hypothetical protein